MHTTKTWRAAAGTRGPASWAAPACCPPTPPHRRSALLARCARPAPWWCCVPQAAVKRGQGDLAGAAELLRSYLGGQGATDWLAWEEAADLYLQQQVGCTAAHKSSCTAVPLSACCMAKFWATGFCPPTLVLGPLGCALSGVLSGGGDCNSLCCRRQPVRNSPFSWGRYRLSHLLISRAVSRGDRPPGSRLPSVWPSAAPVQLMIPAPACRQQPFCPPSCTPLARACPPG